MEIDEVIGKLIHIPRDFHAVRTKSYVDLLIESGYLEAYLEVTALRLIESLEADPTSTDDWFQWSEDQRCHPAWTLVTQEDGVKLAYDNLGSELSSQLFGCRYEACAEFILKNAERTRLSLVPKPRNPKNAWSPRFRSAKTQKSASPGDSQDSLP